ncbi:histidine phosphatase family protein [Salinibacter grassmerensis]|uniref:histidine phosphatase family protein n=1 Tax=Salinibacter grassmerensis TaxID=3040353 RepID=UPI0021E72277|nr:histidine phosphatase family protein [Salinibacter grassmerensis]
MSNGFRSVPVDAPTSLYLVRHGETEYNRRGIMQGGGIDSTLNATGREQARALARRFASADVDALYASTLRRATQTADILAADHEPLSRTHLRDLGEMDWGVYEGEAPSRERDASVDALKSAWRDGAYDRGPEGGESIREVQGRARRALRHILAREAGGTALVVTHGRYLRVLLATLLDAYGLEHMPDLDHSNTCVNHVVYEEGRARAERLNCTAHLPGDSASVPA